MMPAVLAAVLLVPPPAEAAAQLVVNPMAAPKPALRYLLLPEVRELKPGNPMQWYVRCFAEQRYFFFSKQAITERARFRSMPLAELRKQDLASYGGSALIQADYAARLDTVDWQLTERLQTEGTDLLLPELDSLRTLGIALQVRFRGEVSRGDFDSAVRTAKTMFAFARHLGAHPTTAANLVGLAVAGMALDTLEEMIQQPGCPNLYCAFTDLPAPLVNLRMGAQGDRLLAENELRPLRAERMTDGQIEEVVARLSGRAAFAREQAGRPPRSFRAMLARQAKDTNAVASARLRLMAAGNWEALAFSPAQVVLLDEMRRYEIRRDEEIRLLTIPPWQCDRLTGGKLPKSNADTLFAHLFPRLADARLAQARVEQRIAALRHVEALRLYAAEHHGALPGRLDDIALPLPSDPFTGKPFGYTVDGSTAHLHGGSPRGEERTHTFNADYEITIRK